MYARSTTMVAQPDRIDGGIAWANEVLMLVMSDIEGCIGMSLLVHRPSNRCIVTTSWESENTMRASNERLHPTRERFLETLGANDVTHEWEIAIIQEWEIAVLHRDRVSSAEPHARVTWSRPRAGQLDAAVAAFKATELPLLEHQDGFCSASMLVSRGTGMLGETGMLCSTVSFVSRATVEGNRDFAARQRALMTERIGIEYIDVIECELAIHHLRVPELA
ncbi:hypothetical protein JNB63_10530 [Microbacterium trichothecenolyticum]|uniref:ABM domain-containing protein n=1 Tax=Microbacterium ureisolvens TaxID=2781186 RepID=A0ABS7I1R1_9MICO|nr:MULTISPECIES: hypothetical protein [Microbacterium]MBW9110428.1 hypothetical protein [Microbacterium ureisolvens]MBW9120533.1 hypothetical protein [Microbacterium trichothecenolyticum]